MHHLKIKKEYFHDVCMGVKTFEVREEILNERIFFVYESVCLHELDGDNETGRSICFLISYVHRGLGIEKGYAVLGIKALSELSY